MIPYNAPLQPTQSIMLRKPSEMMVSDLEKHFELSKHEIGGFSSFYLPAIQRSGALLSSRRRDINWMNRQMTKYTDFITTRLTTYSVHMYV
jgi:hypothetical protein